MKYKSKILVVDDNEMNLKILQEMLEPDYKVVTCNSGEEALNVLSEFRPEIVLLDIMMPGMNGYEVCKRIRKKKDLAHTKVIMVSAKAMIEERLKGYEVGADDYVTKPFNDEELLSKIRVFLRLKSVEEIDGFKTEVLSLLSDELCTPLKSLTLPAEILKSDEDIDLDKRKRYAELIVTNAQRLQTFIEKVLTLTTMRAGKWKYDIKDVDLSELARACIAKVQQRHPGRDVKFEDRLGSSVCVSLDAHQVELALRELLENAIRFSPEGGEVTVGISEEDGMAMFRVKDRGKGIPEKALPHLFDGLLNVDADGSGALEEPDWQLIHGLGLALTREIVVAHGGEIGVKSQPGTETEFAVRLPLASATTSRCAATPEAVTAPSAG